MIMAVKAMIPACTFVVLKGQDRGYYTRKSIDGGLCPLLGRRARR